MDRDRTPLTVLAIEDNPGDLVIIEEYLEERFYLPKVLSVATYVEARRILEGQTSKIDVVLLDLSLPDMAGEELVREITTLVPDLPIIVLTGYAETEFAIKSLTLGVSDFLVKDELTEAILHKSITYNIERKRNMVRLEHSRKQYSDLFHLSPQPMWVYDLTTFVFLDVNKAAIEHYGYSRDEFLGMTILDIRPKEDIPRVLEVVKNRDPAVESTFKGIFTHRKKDGSLIKVEIMSNMLEFDGRQGRLILVNDITARLAQQAAIERQNHRLREIAWMQSHVVRAPLARILGLIDGLKFGEDKETLTQYLRHIEDSACELDNVVRDIINKSEAIKLEDSERVHAP